MKDVLLSANDAAVNQVSNSCRPSKSELIREATMKFCAGVYHDKTYDLGALGSQLLEITNQFIDNENAIRGNKEKFTKIKRLTHSQIADLIMATRHVKLINCTGIADDPNGSDDVLGVYMISGPFAGTYVTDCEAFNRLSLEIDYYLRESDLREIYRNMIHRAEKASRTTDPNLIAVNNGVFDYRSKELMPFDPSYIFLSKVTTDYVASARPVYITEPDGSTWDVDTWMNSLSNDPEIITLLWQLLSAVVRPFVRWDKMVWLYAETGNNGKGTLVQLIRNLLGSASISITLSQFADKFGLAHLVGKTAVLTDEVNAGDKIDNLANLKAAVTGDLLHVEKKFKDIVQYRFHGMLIFCVNDKPQIKDKTGSFARRLLIIPFSRCFTGQEKKYIKDDYLSRKDVLEYILNKVLNTDFYELSNPSTCIQALEDFKEENDNVRLFVSEMISRISWDFAPYEFLYELYKSWYRRNQPVGNLEGKSTFIKSIKKIVSEVDIGWESTVNPVRVKNLMNGPEMLIAEYDLQEWFNRTYTGHDLNIICQPTLKDTYRGIRRVTNSGYDIDDT